MQFSLEHRPGNAIARVALEPGESITAEGGAMIAMSGHIGVTTTTHKKGKGGIGAALKRVFAKESFFLNHFEAAQYPGEVLLGTSLPGDMDVLELNGPTLVIEGGAYCASTPDVDIDVGWQGFKNLLSKESMFWITAKGSGKVVIASFGAIYPIDIDGEYIVDTGHIVAFEETLDYKLSKAGSSWLHSILGGEGLVCRFKGKGRVWCQSHNVGGFGSSLTPSLRPR
ncbi:MAG: hypothetical protein ACJAYU_005016 [Bradymonadia bacterium]|jgi:uncharacterized protein (TIGR00266 family)